MRCYQGTPGSGQALAGRENVDPNCRNKNDRTPLRRATAKGLEGVVKLPLERGHVDPDLPERHGGAQLSYVAGESHRVAQPLQTQNSVETPNSRAKREGRWDVCKRLMFSSKKTEADPLVNTCRQELWCLREER